MPSIKSYWKRFGPIKMDIQHNLSSFHSWMDDRGVSYHQPITFNTLTHVTSLENTELILQEGFKLAEVGSYSCVNKLKDNRGQSHPLVKESFLWTAPDTLDTTTAIRYGNVAFSLKNLARLKNLRFYFVEFLDHTTKTAVRVILTTKDYDHLLVRFDPTDETQHDRIPVVYNGAEWLRYTKFSNSRHDVNLLDVEFLLDVVPLQHEMFCRYVKCYDPKPFITSAGKIHGHVKVHNGNMDVIRLMTLLARYQGYNSFQFRSNIFVTDLISALQTMNYRDNFLPEHCVNDLMFREEDEAASKPDYLLSQIDFGRLFDTKEFSTKNWKKVQLLDFIYHQSSSLPNLQTLLNVLNKGVSGMKSERTAQETLTLFLQTFLSGRAKRNVKRMLVNLICSL